MTARYTALGSNADKDAQNDMEAAFDYSEDDDDDSDRTNASESQPLNPEPTSPLHTQSSRPHSPDSYDFENIEYDYPPPGSPPPPSATALPNTHGNTNGHIPQFTSASASAPRQGWFKRSAVAVLPKTWLQHLGLAHQRPAGVVGAGINNDGVFANVTAKPSLPRVIQEGDSMYVVPEESRAEAPPSYASAQADAVPPYWETTVHAPFTPGSPGEVHIENLPIGSLFSFLWNMLVSVSFQFIGFLLTYLLHTTHAARLGSRAGLGVTLIQYGFALRARLDDANGSGSDDAFSGWGEAPRPTTSDGTPQPYSHHHYGQNMNSTMYTAPPLTEEQVGMISQATTEWLSFVLMTFGWFILLTSLLGFWRVKRWERGVLASQQENSNSSVDMSSPFALFTSVESNFSLRGTSRIELLRQGFGFGRNRSAEEDEAAVRAEEGHATRNEDSPALETDVMIPADPNNPAHRRLQEAIEHDMRLQRDLRAAGLI